MSAPALDLPSWVLKHPTRTYHVGIYQQDRCGDRVPTISKCSVSVSLIAKTPSLCLSPGEGEIGDSSSLRSEYVMRVATLTTWNESGVGLSVS